MYRYVLESAAPNDEDGPLVMVICLCKGVSDKKIRQLIAGGAKSLREIMASCKAGSDCGSCVCAVKEMLNQDRCAAVGIAGDGELERAGND